MPGPRLLAAFTTLLSMWRKVATKLLTLDSGLRSGARGGTLGIASIFCQVMNQKPLSAARFTGPRVKDR
jgi:hypothetical protein